MCESFSLACYSPSIVAIPAWNLKYLCKLFLYSSPGVWRDSAFLLAIARPEDEVLVSSCTFFDICREAQHPDRPPDIFLQKAHAEKSVGKWIISMRDEKRNTNLCQPKEVTPLCCASNELKKKKTVEAAKKKYLCAGIELHLNSFLSYCPNTHSSAWNKLKYQHRLTWTD